MLDQKIDQLLAADQADMHLARFIGFSLRPCGEIAGGDDDAMFMHLE